jgi:hypothetical protein
MRSVAAWKGREAFLVCSWNGVRATPGKVRVIFLRTPSALRSAAGVKHKP